MGAILEREPPLVSSFQPLATPTLDRTVGKCLAKDPVERWQSAKDLSDELKWIAAENTKSRDATVPAQRRRAYAVWVVAVVAVIAAAIAGSLLVMRDAALEPQLTRLDVNTPPTTDPMSFALSPDGRQLVFAATPEKASAPDLFVINVDGTNMRRLTTHPDSDTTPTWSPDGTEIAFTSDRTGKPQIYIMRAEPNAPVRRLPIPDGEADRATWAPSPFSEIAYTARTGPGYDIKIHELASGQTRRLTFGEGTNESAVYSPGGRHLAFSSTRFGNVQIFTIGRDGNGLRQITRSGNNQTPDWSN
jgi:Tol biopolymer transport system component